MLGPPARCRGGAVRIPLRWGPRRPPPLRFALAGWLPSSPSLAAGVSTRGRSSPHPSPRPAAGGFADSVCPRADSVCPRTDSVCPRRPRAREPAVGLLDLTPPHPNTENCFPCSVDASPSSDLGHPNRLGDRGLAGLPLPTPVIDRRDWVCRLDGLLDAEALDAEDWTAASAIAGRAVGPLRPVPACAAPGDHATSPLLPLYFPPTSRLLQTFIPPPSSTAPGWRP